MQKTCTNCQTEFPIDEVDLIFYEKMAVTPPTHCYLCRQQRRLAIRNELNLYKRTCDFSGKEILSMYSPDKPHVIYDQSIWWSDVWDPMQYGQDFSFSKPFFEQFQELQLKVPRMSLNVVNNENSEYTNYSLHNKNSYLVTTADYNEDSYYGRFSDRNFNSADFDYTYDSTQCYDCVDMHKCNRCTYSQKCEDSSDLLFCYDMKNCHNCLFSSNLRSKTYFIYNEPVSEEAYKQAVSDLRLSTYAGLQAARQKATEFIGTQPHKYLEVMQCENCLGDYLKQSKNAQYCFDSYNLFDVKYASHVFDAKDVYDWDFVAAGSELCYEVASSGYKLFNCRFVMNSWEGLSNLTYSELCTNGSTDLFGCIGLRKKKHCILNKQYTQEEYEKLVPRIIEYMKETGEWGEFFPISISPYGYNETVAHEYFPLTKEEALAKGYTWKDRNESEYQPSDYHIPDSLEDVPNTITKKTLACETCSKNFKIIEQELKLYRTLNVPIPHDCFSCRHKRRMTHRNPRLFWDRQCATCQVPIQTTYPETNPTPILCEQCYMEAVY